MIEVRIPFYQAHSGGQFNGNIAAIKQYLINQGIKFDRNTYSIQDYDTEEYVWIQKDVDLDVLKAEDWKYHVVTIPKIFYKNAIRDGINLNIFLQTKDICFDSQTIEIHHNTEVTFVQLSNKIDIASLYTYYDE